jgi:hypothetical protein
MQEYRSEYRISSTTDEHSTGIDQKVRAGSFWFIIGRKGF